MTNIFEAPKPYTHNHHTMIRPPLFHPNSVIYGHGEGETLESGEVSSIRIVLTRDATGMPSTFADNTIYHTHRTYKDGQKYNDGEVFSVRSIGLDDNSVEGFLVSVQTQVPA